MGVAARITTCAPRASTAESAAAAAFDRMLAVEDAASDYRVDNELARLCARAGQGYVPVSHDLYRLLRLSEHFSRLTDGAFDVTVGPATRAWRQARNDARLPPPAEIEAVRRAIGWRYVATDADAPRARLLRTGMALDFGGIAKGYAADRALEVLRARGLPRSLVALAGDVVAGEPPPDAAGWQVAVRLRSAPTDDDAARPPATQSLPDDLLLLTNAAVSTSGDLEQFVDIDGVRYAHIVDPRTSLGLTRPVAAAVVAPDGATADALATALCVRGEAGLGLLPAGVEARLIGGEGRSGESPGWSALRRVHAPPPPTTAPR